MTGLAWVYLGGAIMTEVAATLGLRASEGFRRRRWIAPVVAGYVAAFGLLALSLQHGMPVGIAYGVWAAVGIALTAILARFIFTEPLTTRMLIGIALIGIGVLLVEVGATTAA